uniref:Protein arginine N-methyltransferase n=1 Tax=Diabrotica virgifera virgifera TaxID=50390 RepID=A0A6P7GRP9_DIAVI
MAEEVLNGDDKKKRMSVGLYTSCPPSIKQGVDSAFEQGYHFVVTQLTHPSYTRNLNNNSPSVIGRTDRVMRSSDWGRLVVGQLTPTIDLDSEVEHIREHSKMIFEEELGFASHLGVPAIWLTLTKPDNVQLARVLHSKLVSGFNYSVWVNIPMTHPSRYSPVAETEYDTWDWWNKFHTYCNYDKRLGLVLDLSDTKHLLPENELKRWIGEPIRAIVIPTSHFLTNQHGKPVLSKVHQEIIKKFMSLDVQYVIKNDTDSDLSLYNRYISFLGKKLYVYDTVTDFVDGFEDFLQNPLQPLTEHLETTIYEIFEKDNIKYTSYENAVYKAIEIFPKDETPVVMVVGAGRGPLVQAVINVSLALDRKIKVYAVEKNPFAVNTLVHRNKDEWDNDVTIVNGDMRTYKPPELADILVSELLGSFGDNELSPECLDGAQRFLKKSGISIPQSYTSYIAPLQSTKIYNEIRTNRQVDKTLQFCYETPYVTHLANFYEIASPQALFTFKHPNWSEHINNQRYKKLKFQAELSCLLTGFVGYFDTVLYKDVMLSIHPETHTPSMVSWFPIVFPLENPVYVEEGQSIEVAFWRAESSDKVWYEWCLISPVNSGIINPNGRSFFMRKH